MESNLAILLVTFLGWLSGPLKWSSDLQRLGMKRSFFVAQMLLGTADRQNTVLKPGVFVLRSEEEPTLSMEPIDLPT